MPSKKQSSIHIIYNVAYMQKLVLAEVLRYTPANAFLKTSILLFYRREIGNFSDLRTCRLGFDDATRVDRITISVCLHRHTNRRIWAQSQPCLDRCEP